MTFFGETPNFDYDAEEYTALIQEISRQPVDPAIGLPVFGALFGFSILAMGLFDWALAVLVLFPLLFLFPYYVVQLMMQWRMRNHLKSTLAQRVRPTYIPSDSRGWASVYIGVWFATTGVSLALLQLMKR